MPINFSIITGALTTLISMRSISACRKDTNQLKMIDHDSQWSRDDISSLRNESKQCEGSQTEIIITKQFETKPCEIMELLLSTEPISEESIITFQQYKESDTLCEFDSASEMKSKQIEFPMLHLSFLGHK
eukprot:430335_1